MRSRERVLDAAERVMATRGFEAATLARVVEEAGVPMSSVYHYFGSKDGILLAVMERGTGRFFADLPEACHGHRMADAPVAAGPFGIARCDWREDVISAVARRVPRSGSLRLPASGFGFRGPGVSYRTFAAKPLPGFRPDDQVTILASSDSPAFDHTDGSPRDPADQLLVELGRDEWVAHEFTVTELAGLTLTVGLAGAARLAGADGLAGQRSLPSVAVDDTAVPLSAAGTGTAPVSAPGRHVFRVTGTAPATQLAWLELTASLGSPLWRGAQRWSSRASFQ